MKKNILALTLMGLVAGTQVQSVETQSGNWSRWIAPAVVTAGVGYWVYTNFFKTTDTIEVNPVAQGDLDQDVTTASQKKLKQKAQEFTDAKKALREKAKEVYGNDSNALSDKQKEIFDDICEYLKRASNSAVRDALEGNSHKDQLFLLDALIQEAQLLIKEIKPAVKPAVKPKPSKIKVLQARLKAQGFDPKKMF